MNATQRKELAELATQIDTIKEQLESIRDAEQEKYDNSEVAYVASQADFDRF